MLIIFLIVTAVTAVVWYLQHAYSKLSKLGVHHLPVVPFFGNIMWGILKKEHMLEPLLRTIKAFPDDRIVGQYELTTPIFIIKDPELLKNVSVKDFDHFTDRRPFTDESDPLFGRNLLALKGENWKAMRTNLSPMFTSSKIRLMVPFMVEVCERMIQALRTKIQQSQNGFIDVEGKDIASRYGNDVLASCAFGLHVESHTEDNEFYSHARAITNFNFTRLLKASAFRCFPKLAKLLCISVSPSASAKFFGDVVLSEIKHREEKNIIRNDMIHLLMQARKGQLSHDNKDTAGDAGFASVEESAIGKKKHEIQWSDHDLILQAVMLLFAGFDTLSSSVGFMMHQLAINPEVQGRLLEEILENDRRCGGKFEFANIHNLPYLDMVVSESLRCWPPAAFVDRTCVKDYNAGKPYPGANNDCIIRKGDYIGLPIWAFHYNPEYFPNPEKFDPERFTEENKQNIRPYTYIPFGLGPKNCLGSRFVLYEIKIFIYQMILNFKFGTSEKTAPKAIFSKQGYDMKIVGGWERLTMRSQ